jgi:hypothetical protein
LGTNANSPTTRSLSGEERTWLENLSNVEVGRLAGKIALISGASRGQGAAEARLFAAEGAAVVLTDVLDQVAFVSLRLSCATMRLRDNECAPDWA